MYSSHPVHSEWLFCVYRETLNSQSGLPLQHKTFQAKLLPSRRQYNYKSFIPLNTHTHARAHIRLLRHTRTHAHARTHTRTHAHTLQKASTGSFSTVARLGMKWSGGCRCSFHNPILAILPSPKATLSHISTQHSGN